MTQVDPSQFLNADGSPLTADQIAALTPPAAPPAPPEPTGPTLADRELAVARAGFNLNDPLVGALAKGYDGPLDQDTITAVMAAVGVAPTGSAPPAAPPATAAAEGQGDVRQGLAGAEYVPPPPPPEKTAYERADDAIAQARAEGHDEAIQRQVGIQEILGAAMNGDTSVTVAERHAKRADRWTEIGQMSNTR